MQEQTTLISPQEHQEIFEELQRLRADVDALKRNIASGRANFGPVFERIMSSHPLAVAIFDRNMRYILANPKWLQDYGLGDRNVVGLPHFDLIKDDIPDRWREAYEECLMGQSQGESERADPFPRSDGAVDFVDWEVHPWYDDRPEPAGIIVYQEVVTNRIEDARERDKTISELRQANTMKNEFMATVSHELRTPLNAIIGHSGVILAGMIDDAERQEAKIQSIYDSANHLLSLINDILDLQKIESGQLPVVPKAVSLNDLVTRWQDILGPKAAEKSLELEIDVDNDVPEVIFVDAKLLSQIVINLGNNAVKFTDEGNVNIVVEWSEEASELFLRVSDTGVGIPPNELDLIFEEFYQVEGTKNRALGTGLGLAIVRRIVRAMGGTINVDSHLDEGTTFNITLPIDMETILHARE